MDIFTGLEQDANHLEMNGFARLGVPYYRIS